MLSAVLDRFPSVKAEDLELSTGGAKDGVFFVVKHLPSGKARGVRGLTPETFQRALDETATLLLQEVTKPSAR